jgi:hypothetical protein
MCYVLPPLILDKVRSYMQIISHDETWKCADQELKRQIRCFPYGERSGVPRLQQVEQKAVGWQRNLGLILHDTLWRKEYLFSEH